MSHSKIFSGDLPELIYEVIKYFRNDFSTLYSCILVNRLWCRLAIPLLWEDPFSIPTKNYKFIYVYLHNLNDDLKTKLNEYEINFNLLHSNTLFNYPSFIKYLNTCKIISSIEKWSEDDVGTLKSKNRNSHLVSDFRRLIQMSLFKTFNENEVKLHTLDFEIFNFESYNSYYDDIIEFILDNPTFIHNVKNLKLYIGLSSGFSYLNTSFGFSYCHTTGNKYTLQIKDRILQIVKLQQNLKKIFLSFNSLPLYQPLLLSKGSNCSNTLNTIIFYYVNFKSTINLDKVFEQLNVLESIHIVYCFSLNTAFIQQIINLTKPFKLKSLFINEGSQIDESLQLLLQKSGNYLENFGFGYGSDLFLRQQILKSVIEYSKNIKYLEIFEVGNQIDYLIFDLIESIKQNLNYLSITAIKASRLCDNSSIILQNLGRVLPNKLEYLSLTLNANINDFRLFLDSSNAFIKKLLIKSTMRNKIDEMLPYVKDYLVKKKRVKYLAIKETFFLSFLEDNKELFYLNDIVQEFALNNVIVRRYNDLSIYICQFISKLH
ncbi:hypothetical protein RclHR1_14770004 [Rhizophagus clarus]|uniref:F-box domain-containing protein n=1 Tax=Rhizophagus clarus TaxID=94130 RepID=A0A2Z6QDD8_9GLOM|nr:hypothetical protein RclHR1_14770004 [Rhizophagus clarus]GES72793.1 hypothetical protein GLOIN_2v1886066 [Rhizophagus clarus]